MPATRSGRKRQAQLTFSPLPESSPARASQPEATRKRAAAVVIDGSPSPSNRKKRKIADIFLPTPLSSSQNAPATETSSPSSRRTRSFMSSGSATAESSRNKRRKQLVTLNESESDDEVEQPSTVKQPRISACQSPPTLTDSDDDVPRRSRKFRPTQIVLDGSDDEDPTNKVGRSPRKRKRITQLPDESASDLGSGRESSSGEELPRRRTGRKTSSSAPATPPAKLSQQARDDLKEDLDFLESADTPTTSRRAQTQQSAKRTALEILKQRRLKQAGTKPLPGTNRRVVIDEEDVRADDDTEEGSDGDAEDDTELAPDASIYESDHYDEDFVIDDGEETLGAPVELPFEFSNFRTMKPQDLFKYVVEWMVQKKINPAFAMEDDVYRIAFDRLDDFVKGLGGSKFQSSAWTSNFTKALRARPVLEDYRFMNSGLEHDRCDACNRSGHPATFEVKFTGKTYHRVSLEEDSSEDESDDEEVRSSSIPSANVVYYIGKHCMQNARTAHALYHWRYHLNEWVVDYLKEQGYCTAEEIVRRDGWSINKRQRYANKIVDRMEEAKEIKRLHRDFKNEIKTAQYANESRSRYENSSP